MSARCVRLGFALFASLALAAPLVAQGNQKSIFLSVLDPGSGAPITGLTAADFAIREEGKDLEVVSVKPATQPMCIAVLADTSKEMEEFVPDMRKGLKAFVEQVQQAAPATEIGLWEFGQAAIRIKDFSTDTAAVTREVERIFPKPRAPSVLLEALLDASDALAKRPCPRKAIVVLNVEPSDETSSQQPKKILDSMIKSRAQLWVVSVQKGQLKNPKRDVVFTDLVRNGGGMRQFLVAESGIEGHLRKYAAALAGQYELTYTRLGGKPQVVQTGLRRDGKLIAGIIAPQ